MKGYQKTICFAPILFLCCLIVALPIQARAATIKLNYKSLTMQAGDKVDLNISDKGLVKSTQKVTWTSSNKKVATVNKNGVVTAKKKGTATITAKTADKKGKASCKVTVRKKAGSQTKVLVAYFSATNTTKGIAEKIADVTGGDLYRITPAKAYTSKDLDYGDDGSRTTKEQNNPKSRPQLKGNVASIGRYDVIFLGYPIWWGDAPRVISTFLESYDFSGKKVIPFCTSGSSGISESEKNLRKLTDEKTVWLSGKRFPSDVTEEEVRKWVEDLGIQNKREDVKLKIQVGDTVMTAAFEDNSSARGFQEKLAKAPVTITMSDYGSFEKVGALGFDLPRNDKQITTEPGDIILYQGNQITIYYDTNTWSFTRMARITDKTQEELKTILGTGDVTVTFSLSE